MDKKRRTFSEEFKQAAVARVVSKEATLAQVARELQIDQSLLQSWKQKLAVEQTAHRSNETLEEENRRLRRENASLREDREILKKASAFFAKELK